MRIRSLLITLVAPVLLAGAVLFPASANAASSSKPTLLIGALVSETNPSAPGTKVTYWADVLNAWAKMINAKGGINGMQVKTIVLDDGTDPAKASAGVKTLIADNVVAIVGSSGGATQTVWEPIADQAGIPVIGGGCYGASFNTDENFFCVTTTAILDGLKAQVKYAADQGAKSFGITYASDIPAAAAAAPLFKSLATGLGLTYTASVGTTNTQPDYTAACVTFKQAGTTDVGIEGAPLLQNMARDCARQNYFPKYTSGDGQISQNGWLNNPGIRHAIAAVYSFPFMLTKGSNATQTASLQQFHAAMNKYAPQVLKSDYKQPATVTWTAAKAFEVAARTIPAGTTPTAALIKAGLYTFNKQTLGGLAPNPLTFTSGQPHPHNSCWWGEVLKNHKLTAPAGMKTTCTP